MSIHVPRDGWFAVNFPRRLGVVLVGTVLIVGIFRRSEPDRERAGSDADDFASGRVVGSHRRDRLADARTDQYDERCIKPATRCDLGQDGPCIVRL